MMAAEATPRVAAARAATWLVVALAAAWRSVVWWRADVVRCACECCPDEHCLYAEHIRAVLLAPGAASWRALSEFAQGFIHAQIPLSALAAALPAIVLPSAAGGLMLVSVLATVLARTCTRRVVVAAWRPDAACLALLAVTFWTNPSPCTASWGR